MKISASEGRELVLFEDMHQHVTACLFCGDVTEGRYMCSKCRRKPLAEIFWIVRAQVSELGLVTIRRKRGRIAGFGAPPCPVEVLWCGTNRPRRKHGHRSNGWSFPPRVRELLLQETQGLTVLHLFGGKADFGCRLDLDSSTNPDFVGDAFLPPFERDSFDVVILDPPYYRMHRQEIIALLRAAAWIARRHIYWLHTVWIDTNRLLPLQHAWMIRVGDQCAMRCLEKFAVREPKARPLQPGEFQRGEALKYNRWLQAGPKLPFSEYMQIGPDLAQLPAHKVNPENGVFLGDWA